MCFKNTKEKWGGISQGLHWLIAVMFLGMWLVAELMHGIQHNPENTIFGFQKYALYGLHKSFGVVILALVLFRLGWRLLNTVPSEGMKANKLERLAGSVVHLALYAVMFIMPISGYIMSQAGGHGVAVFGYALPNVLTFFIEGGKSMELAKLANEIHHETFEIFWLLLALHIGAALYHYYMKRDNVLQRMLPVRKS